MGSSSDPGTSAFVQRLRGVDRAWLVIGAVLVGALGVMILGALMAPERQDDMWVNIVGRSAQLIALALAGGVVGAVIHDRDAAREAVRRRDELLQAFLDDVETAFGQTKTARRLLRAHGIDGRHEPILTAEQVTVFRTQMAMLNDAELQFETLARKVAAMSRPLGMAAAEVVARLTAAHSYLNQVLHEWEADPGAIVASGTTSVIATWPHFSGFVAYDDEADLSFRRGVVDQILAVEVAIRATTAGSSPARRAGREDHG